MRHERCQFDHHVLLSLVRAKRGRRPFLGSCHGFLRTPANGTGVGQSCFTRCVRCQRSFSPQLLITIDRVLPASLVAMTQSLESPRAVKPPSKHVSIMEVLVFTPPSPFYPPAVLVLVYAGITTCSISLPTRRSTKEGSLANQLLLLQAHTSPWYDVNRRAIACTTSRFRREGGQNSQHPFSSISDTSEELRPRKKH